VDQSFALPCSLTSPSIQLQQNPFSHTAKECKDGGGGGREKSFFTLVHKITNVPVLYIKYKVIDLM